MSSSPGKGKGSEAPLFKVHMKHTEQTFTELAHAQYDMFCKRNYIARMIISAVFICIGAARISKWYSILLIAYGGYLMTGKYSSSNHTVRKLIDNLNKAGLPFPESEYSFYKDRMTVTSLPDGEELAPLYYSNIVKLSYDLQFFYLFRNESGGYMIPKDQLGDDPTVFRDFIEKKSGKAFISRRGSMLSKMSASVRRKENTPDRLPDYPGSRFRFRR